MHEIESDAGSGSVLALAIISATVALALALIGVIGAFVIHTNVSVAADAAALAAADTASARIPGEPCERAASAAALHGVTLEVCDASRTEANVTVSADFGWFTMAVSARAGLPRT